ncbi:ComEA family DNA-binding protein [Solwaraspora sp. WMMD791]|uniref:ComEA family DNA-binding protein n=1 Tax=Solwaraspora sp. WMMD791 TaxID=3016086 RepID=UPI002499D3A4|nr:ComEA family DNA-binding protein [Solwaraspora sp. WMMD791]WFE29807.1 ComEA family DNA-binding protein [Solwaraspora sp. WMMD791]
MTDHDTVRRRLARLRQPASRSPSPSPSTILGGPGGSTDPTGSLGPVDGVDGEADDDPAEWEQPPADGLATGGPGRLAAFDPGHRGVKALAAVAVVVVAVAAFLAWRSRPPVDPVTPALSTAVGSTAPISDDPVSGGPPTGAATTDPATGTVSAEVVVAVTGRVHRPGLVTLPAGARVADALAAAGGALPGTDLAWLNLARQVTDGELVAVGATPPPGVVLDPGVPGGGGHSGTGSSAGGGKVNLNSATLQQLETLPGVGPVLAQRIVDHRERVGGFGTVADLREVSGIGDARFEQLRDLVIV